MKVIKFIFYSYIPVNCVKTAVSIQLFNLKVPKHFLCRYIPLSFTKLSFHQRPLHGELTSPYGSAACSLVFRN